MNPIVFCQLLTCDDQFWLFAGAIILLQVALLAAWWAISKLSREAR